MNKFEDVDVIASLEAIMKQNTAFYQNDFDLDRNILQKAAASPTAEDRRLLWFSRPSGTSCFRERDVFLKGTRQHNTWRFYGEQTRDKVLAYAVELTGIVNGKIKGNLYELDYPQHFRHVKEQALPADNYTLLYEHGERVQLAGQYLDGNPDPQLGKMRTNRYFSTIAPVGVPLGVPITQVTVVILIYLYIYNSRTPVPLQVFPSR